MTFWLLNQYYPPDPAPTGKYLQDLARMLTARGHQVTVFCSRRGYDGKAKFPRHEVADGVEVVRLTATGFGRRGFAGKLSDYVSFYLALAWALVLRRGKPGVILGLTTPPYIGLLSKLAAWRHRARHAHWIMDIYPDVMLAHGMTQRRGPVAGLLRCLTRFELRGSAATIALGPVMAERVAAYTRCRRTEDSGQLQSLNPQPSTLNHSFNPQPSTINHSFNSQLTWLPLWSVPALRPWDADEPNPLRKGRGWEKDLVFLYSGNMGLGHRLGEFLEVARRLGSGGPRWAFSGGGKRRTEVQSFAAANPQARIELLGYVPDEDLRAHLCSANVHLASLDSAWQGLMVPSKVQASFAVGKPVLFVGDHHNETARWILEAGAGWVVPENDITGLLEAIDHAKDPLERRKRGDAALRFAQVHFQMTATCGRLADLLEAAGPRAVSPSSVSPSSVSPSSVSPSSVLSPRSRSFSEGGIVR